MTGRECAATMRRMQELRGGDYLFQNVKDKVLFLRQFMEENRIKKETIGYIGDDLNDLFPMKLTGFIACPADACREITEIANYVSPVKGGNGAVRDVIEYLLRRSGEWDQAVSEVYGIGM